MSDPQKKRIKRSRLGCHRCKKLKTKCSEDRPSCVSCSKAGVPCDYTLKLTWGGRPYKNAERRKAFQVVKPVSPVQATGNAKNITFVENNFEVVSVKSEDGEQKSQSTNASPSVKLESESLDNDVTHMAPTISTSTNLTDISQDDTQAFERYLNGRTLPLLFLDMHTIPHDRNLQHIESPNYHSPSAFLTGLIDGFSSDLAELERQNESNVRSGETSSSGRAGSSQALIKTPPSIGSVSPMSPITPLTDPLLRYHSLLGHSSSQEEYQPPQQAYVSIPPQLTPLPDILIKVPHYRQLLNFWVEVASNELVPAPSHLYIDNPLKVLVPQMAMRYPSVLTTLLAFAAKWRGVIMNDLEDGEELVDLLLTRSCNELLKQLQDEREATSDGVLLTSLLLSCYEVMTSNDFEKHRTHTIGASQIVLARNAALATNQTSPTSDDSDSSERSLSVVYNRDESSIAFVLTRWFFYVDVIGALSSTRGHDKYLRAYTNGNRYTPVRTVGLPFHDAHDIDPRNDIDFFMGFDTRIIPHLINIALLIREVEKIESASNGEALSLPVWLITAALELKENIKEAHLAGEARRQALTEKAIDTKLKGGFGQSPKNKGIEEVLQHDNTLRATNMLFYLMGVLNLVRRVLKVPRLSPIVQEIANDMADVLRFGIEPRSSAELCTIFCHFCAGCELLDTERRQAIYERHTWMARSGNNNATKSLLVMSRCWETGEDWTAAADALDIDLVLM